MATCLFLDNYEYMIELLNERVDVNGCSKFIVTENEIVNKIGILTNQIMKYILTA